jgi:hypothetical protein
MERIEARMLMDEGGLEIERVGNRERCMYTVSCGLRWKLGNKMPRFMSSPQVEIYTSQATFKCMM